MQVLNLLPHTDACVLDFDFKHHVGVTANFEVEEGHMEVDLILGDVLVASSFKVSVKHLLLFFCEIVFHGVHSMFICFLFLNSTRTVP